MIGCMDNTRRLAALLAITTCAAVALIVVTGSDILTWVTDRPEVLSALILAAAVVFAAMIVADSLGRRA
jgi:hypothetical protein